MSRRSRSSEGAVGPAPQAVLRPAAEVETAALGPNRVAFLLGLGENGSFSLTEFVMAPPPAPGPPPHVHEDADEAVYVLDGTLEMGIEGRTLTGSAGSVMFVPKGTPHSLANPGSTPARMLVILSPAGCEGFWRETAALRAQPSGPPSMEVVAALQRKYHLATAGAARRFE